MPFSPGLIFVQDGYICNGCGSASVVLIEVLKSCFKALHNIETWPKNCLKINKTGMIQETALKQFH